MPEPCRAIVFDDVTTRAEFRHHRVEQAAFVKRFLTKPVIEMDPQLRQVVTHAIEDTSNAPQAERTDRRGALFLEVTVAECFLRALRQVGHIGAGIPLFRERNVLAEQSSITR